MEWIESIFTIHSAVQTLIVLSLIVALAQLLRFILVFLANQRFVFLICFTVFYKF